MDLDPRGDHRRHRHLPHRRLQRPDPPAKSDRKRLVADRRAAEAAHRPDPQPRRDRQGLCSPREGHARRGRQARNAAIAAPATPAGQAAADTQITGALRQLFALSEAYPDLKANQNFLALQEELTATEGRVAYSRQFYNDSVLGLQQQAAGVPDGVLRQGAEVRAPRILRDRRSCSPGAQGRVLKRIDARVTTSVRP